MPRAGEGKGRSTVHVLPLSLLLEHIEPVIFRVFAVDTRHTAVHLLSVGICAIEVIRAIAGQETVRHHLKTVSFGVPQVEFSLAAYCYSGRLVLSPSLMPTTVARNMADSMLWLAVQSA